MLFYESFFPVVWIVFVLYWQIKAADTKATQRLEPLDDARLDGVPRAIDLGDVRCGRAETRVQIHVHLLRDGEDLPLEIAVGQCRPRVWQAKIKRAVVIARLDVELQVVVPRHQRIREGHRTVLEHDDSAKARE